MIKQIAITKSKIFYKPSEFYGVLELFGSNILTSNEEIWERHRKIVGPHFTLEKHLRKIHEASISHAHTMFEVWENEKLFVCVKNSFKNYTLDIIGSAAFGYEMGALKEWKLSNFPKSEIPEGVSMTLSESLQTILSAAVIYYLFGRNFLKWLPFQFARKLDSEEERHDLLSLMIRSEGLSEKEIKANAFIFFIAGHETTATTLTWALYRIAQNPQVQQKVNLIFIDLSKSFLMK